MYICDDLLAAGFRCLGVRTSKSAELETVLSFLGGRCIMLDPAVAVLLPPQARRGWLNRPASVAVDLRKGSIRACNDMCVVAGLSKLAAAQKRQVCSGPVWPFGITNCKKGRGRGKVLQRTPHVTSLFVGCSGGF